MEAYFFYLLALFPTEQHKPAQNNSLNSNFAAVEINTILHPNGSPFPKFWQQNCEVLRLIIFVNKEANRR